MDSMAIWNKVVLLAQQPFELHTIPKNSRNPRWFQVNAGNNTLYINKSLNHRPSVELSMPRAISYKDFQLVYGYYERWKSGEVGIRNEVSRQSRNTAYIFALIHYAKEE